MRFRGVASWAIGLLRRSLQARAVFSTVVISGLSLALVGGFLSYSIGGGLYSTRQAQVLAESERAVVEVQNTFSSSSVSNEVALQTLMNTIVPSLESTGTTNSRRVALLRSPGQTAVQVLQSPISADLDTGIIPADLRAKVRVSSGKLLYQSVGIPVAGSEHPGIVVGAPVQIPLAGNYELYLVFDLNSEQQTLDFVQRTLVFGGLALLLMIGAISFFVTDWLVRPVRAAAEVSEQLADGALDRRLPERGEDIIAVLARSFNKMAQSL